MNLAISITLADTDEPAGAAPPALLDETGAALLDETGLTLLAEG